jgi:hypothetical protein
MGFSTIGKIMPASSRVHEQLLESLSPDTVDHDASRRSQRQVCAPGAHQAVPSHARVPQLKFPHLIEE